MRTTRSLVKRSSRKVTTSSRGDTTRRRAARESATGKRSDANHTLGAITGTAGTRDYVKSPHVTVLQVHGSVYVVHLLERQRLAVIFMSANGILLINRIMKVPSASASCRVLAVDGFIVFLDALSLRCVVVDIRSSFLHTDYLVDERGDRILSRRTVERRAGKAARKANESTDDAVGHERDEGDSDGGNENEEQTIVKGSERHRSYVVSPYGYLLDCETGDAFALVVDVHQLLRQLTNCRVQVHFLLGRAGHLLTLKSVLWQMIARRETLSTVYDCFWHVMERFVECTDLLERMEADEERGMRSVGPAGSGAIVELRGTNGQGPGNGDGDGKGAQQGSFFSRAFKSIKQKLGSSDQAQSGGAAENEAHTNRNGQEKMGLAPTASVGTIRVGNPGVHQLKDERIVRSGSVVAIPVTDVHERMSGAAVAGVTVDEVLAAIKTGSTTQLVHGRRYSIADGVFAGVEPTAGKKSAREGGSPLCEYEYEDGHDGRDADVTCAEFLETPLDTLRRVLNTVSPDGMCDIVERVRNSALVGNGWGRYATGVVIEFVRVCSDAKIPVPYAVSFGLVQMFVSQRRFGELVQMLKFGMLRESAEIALTFAALSKRVPGALQLAMDMFKRLKKHDLVAELMIRNGRVVDGIAYSRQHGLTFPGKRDPRARRKGADGQRDAQRNGASARVATGLPPVSVVLRAAQRMWEDHEDPFPFYHAYWYFVNLGYSVSTEAEEWYRAHYGYMQPNKHHITWQVNASSLEPAHGAAANASAVVGGAAVTESSGTTSSTQACRSVSPETGSGVGSAVIEGVPVAASGPPAIAGTGSVTKVNGKSMDEGNDGESFVGEDGQASPASPVPASPAP